MFGLWRKVTASLLVAQLLTGYCCAHHAGLCDASVQFGSTPGATVADRPDSDCLGESPEQNHHGHQGCQIGSCSATLLNRVISVPIQPSQDVAVSLHGDLPALIGNPSEQQSTQPDGLLLPVRLHLINQVLLI